MPRSMTLSLSLLSLVFARDLMSWKRVVEEIPPTSQQLNFPLNANQDWYTRESYLVWKPFEDDLDDNLREKIDAVSDVETIYTSQLKHPKFNWSSGVRLAVGKYLPYHDLWDLNFVGTYYYSTADRKTKISDPLRERINSLWNAPFFSIPLQSTENWRLNYFTTDVNLGRQFLLTPNLQIHPFIGARAAFIFQDYKVRYDSAVSISKSDFEQVKLTVKNEHGFWAGGPRIGTDLAYHFGRGWSFLASVSGSFFYARYSIVEKMVGITPTSFVRPYHLSVKDSDTLLRTNLEGSIGIEWEKWVRDHSVRIAPSFQVEASEWFGLKRWVETHLPSAVIPSRGDLNLQSRRRYSDLGLLGFNINLHIDF